MHFSFLQVIENFKNNKPPIYDNQELLARSHCFLSACQNFNKEEIDLYYDKKNSFISQITALKVAITMDNLACFKYLLYDKDFASIKDIQDSYLALLTHATSHSSEKIFDYMLSEELKEKLQLNKENSSTILNYSLFLAACSKENKILDKLLLEYNYEPREFELEILRKTRNTQALARIEKIFLTKNLDKSTAQTVPARQDQRQFKL